MFSRKFLDRALTVFIALVLLGALGMLLYTVTRPQLISEFTEFYLLNLEGKASDYPGDLKVGQEGEVIVGIVNHEKKVTTYKLEVLIDDVLNRKIDALVLANEEKWEQAIGFTPDKTGHRQKVEFLLFKNGQDDPSLTLHLWIDVTD